MKEKYNEPEIELVLLVNDVIRTSDIVDEEWADEGGDKPFGPNP